MSEPIELTPDFFRTCIKGDGPVALHLSEHLVPVEGEGEPFFPPTFASDRSPYVIDELSDGTRVALVDSVGAQANRMEPLFLEKEFENLVPQIRIAYGDKKKDNEGSISLLEAGHRLGDAIVRCTKLKDEAHEAFRALSKGDANPIAKLSPTSLVFGAWDSRDTGTKVPRIVQSVVRAWDVSVLQRSAQYFPAIDYKAEGVTSEKEAGNDKSPAAQRGYVAVPSTNVPGGVVAKGGIRRSVTINLVALRRLKSETTAELQAYLLGLAAIAAGEAQDPFLRQGCMLVPDPQRPPKWEAVERDGSRRPLKWSTERARTFARDAAKEFGVGDNRELKFDKKLADADKKAK